MAEQEVTYGEKVEFLKNHFRYYTMNSWNGSTSFAANVKIHKFVPCKLRDTAYELLEVREPFDDIECVLDDFAASYNHGYQIGFNGRSGGYLVLYEGGRKPSEYSGRCKDCGQLRYNWKEGDVCGKCGSKNTVAYSGYTTYVSPGKSIELSGDAEDGEDEYEVNELYKVVKDFDDTVEMCKAIFLDYCRNFEVVDEVISVPKTVKKLREKTA